MNQEKPAKPKLADLIWPRSCNTIQTQEAAYLLAVASSGPQ
jgi:hypothetical protein